MPGIVLAVLSLPWCCEHFILKNNGIKECVGTVWVFPQEWGSLSTLGRSRHHHHPCRSHSTVCGNWPVPSGNTVSLSVADLFWAGFWAVVDVVPGGLMLWSAGSSVASEQVILMGLKAPRVACLPSSAEAHILVHGKAVGRKAGICSCSMLQPGPGYWVQTTLKLPWKRGKKEESVPHQERLQLSRQASALLGGTAGH